MQIKTKAPVEHSADPEAIGSYRWYALGILFLVSVLNTIDKMLIPALAEPLRQEFDLSDSELGFLVGIVFSVAYALASLPVGLMIDRLNRTRLLAGLLVLWSTMTLISAKTGSYISLALCRMGVAAAESGGNPTSLSLLGDYFPPKERGRAIGIFSANSAIASVLVYASAGIIAAEYGWRAVFMAASVPGFILAIVILLTLKEPQRSGFNDRASAASDPKPNLAEIFKAIFANKTLLLVTIAAVFVIIGQAGSGAFTAAFFVRLHDLPLANAGLITGLVMGPGFAIGTIVGGFIADNAAKNSPGGGCRFIALVTLLAVPFGIVGYSVNNLTTAVIFLFVFQVLGTCFYGATLATILTLSPIKIRGSIMTYITLIMNLGGYGFGPQITGIFSDLFRWFGAVEPLRLGLVGVVSMMLISAVFYYKASRAMDAESIINTRTP